MFSFFKRRIFRLLIGFLLIAIVIWVLAPYLSFAGYALETAFARLLAIGLVVGCWLVWALIKRLRASQASTRLVSAVLRQSPREQEAQPSAEAAKLRERFEEAVGALAKRGKVGRSLYDLPWYVFIGAPGSGKTTALVNSGLKFPLDQRGGRASVRGVGGTRNCDWWFADEAVFLDTAGRYTTQDSDATSDSEGWHEFLALLTKYRKRRPLNGVILTISAQDLLLQSEAGREDHVDAARRRLNELTRDLQIQLPVYVMVTKCDMVAGFSEYFDDLTQEDRAQVWGVTFPYDESLSGEAAEAFPEEFDALVGRLNDRVFSRLDDERGSRRRASIFAFPQQVSTLREPLAQFVVDVFSTAGADQQILLRGVYLTSGTQDGTQIDRLLGSIGRRFGVAPEAVAPAAPGRGKAFFVQRLLKDVLIGESGLASVNTRLERRNAAWQFGAYAAVLLVLVVGLIVLFVSYGKNRTYLSEVAADVDTLRRVTPRLQGASLELLVPHLNAVRAVSNSANRYEGGVPWSMRWGLYQGSSVGQSARDAYVRALDGVVLPRFAARVRQRLAASAQEPEKLYLYLKAYLMLGEPEHLDRKLLKEVADSEWRMPDATPGAGTSLSNHFESLLEYGGSLRPVPLDQTLVAQARSSIKQTSIPQIMLDELRRSYSEDTARAVHLDIIAGVGIEKVLARKSGRKLSEPVPSFYTSAVFKEATGLRMEPLIKKFTVDDAWVLGGNRLSVANWASQTSQVIALYERDYKRAWDELLNDLIIVPFSTVQQYRDALGILVGAQSPLRGLLKIVVDNTTIIASASGAQQPGGLSGLGTRITEGAEGVLNSAKSKIVGGSSAAPGTEITLHFEPIHRLAAGAPAPIDGTLEQMKKIRDQLLTLGPQAGGSSSLKAITDPALLDMLRTLRQDATNLPPPFDGLVTQISQNAGGSVGAEATRELDQLYRDQVVSECRARVEDRYPFGDGHAGDVSLSDFSLVFGYGGVYDKFFSERLEKLVNTSQRPWTWRPDSVHLPPGFLGQFERATGIRQMFFDAGTKALQLEFTATLSKLDATATRFYVDIDGQRFDAKPDVPMRWKAVWPDPKSPGYALATFEDRVAQPEQVLYIAGPWAFFKMIDETVVPQRDATGAVVLGLQTRYHRGVMTIEPAGGSTVPYASRDWRQFGCGS